MSSRMEVAISSVVSKSPGSPDVHTHLKPRGHFVEKFITFSYKF